MWTERDNGNEAIACNGPGTANSVVLMDDRILAAASSSAAASTPQVSNLNVNKSSRVHIGPKFVSVTQNVQNAEMIKGRILGLELVSTKHARRVRCSVAVFVCWAFLVACGLAIYLIYIALATQQARLDIGLKEPWYHRRGDWQAMPEYRQDFLALPLSYVIIGHSATRHCNQKYSCIELMVSIQQDHLRWGLLDIGPNYLVGGNGFVFEGRGANVMGAMVAAWNRRSITVMFLGNYVRDMPDDAQFDHINKLLETLVNVGVLRPDYTVFGQCQVQPLTVPPGQNVMASIQKLTHWNPANVSGCLPG
ncbi:peptidoglycan-recognition protein SC2-like isoform X2 [Colias croceus]|uniref:peptidoglycan-recognition protein SC2-like isoform X2 n=1 Tax=Colias crocea TaxID=72248 RepID=UPI001E281772|nr:peptidoglycan-recognition protein SC2-like isoform X2 [Colias croceus]